MVANRGSDRQPSSESAFGRVIGKSRPARWSCASARPSSPQWAAVGRRTATPSRKVAIAADTAAVRVRWGALGMSGVPAYVAPPVARTTADGDESSLSLGH